MKLGRTHLFIALGIAVLGGGVLAIHHFASGGLESNMDADTRKAVELALQRETNPEILQELADRLRTAGFPNAAGTVEAKAKSL